MREVGQTGLIRFGGFVFEEFLKELQGPKGMAVYREMSNNDPTVGAALFAFDQLVRKVKWRVDDSESTGDDAAFLQDCMTDMAAPWVDTISEILSFIPFGFSYHEICYKHRLGENPGYDPLTGEPLPTSKYNDGLIGWAKLPIRAQETLWQWEFSPSGGTRAMIQRAAPHFQLCRIPIEKALLFRHRAHKNNPEGVSALRNSYRPWYFKKKLEVIEAIGIERDLAGLPVAKIPAELLSKDATPEQKALLAIFKGIVKNIRMDEQGGIIWPLAYDEDKNEKFKLELLSTGGRRAIDTNLIIGRYDGKIAQTLLSDLILIGNNSRGSYSMMETKIDLFTQAIEGWLDSIEEIFNRYAVPRLMALNGRSIKLMPKIAHGPVSKPDLKDLATYITSMYGSGAVTPQPADEHYLREMGDMPALGDNPDLGT